MEYFWFFIKKTLSVAIYPVGLTLTFSILGLAMARKKRFGAAKALFVAAVSTLFVFSLGWTGITLVKFLEDEAGPYADPAKLANQGVTFIVVLGGTSFTSNLSASDMWDRSALRLLEGIRLWRGMPNAKLALSGGAPSSAEKMAELPMFLGIPRESLILETRALDTDDEARLFKPTVGEKPFALVTSASHMPRSLSIFRSMGMNPIACPCDFRAKGNLPIFVLLSPGPGMENSQIAMHEYYGRLFYWLKNQFLRINNYS
ncbi:MAG: ElyC/SanA/YdcF family protein [Pseudomonadota bacterium]